jgi:hypothetical protein
VELDAEAGIVTLVALTDRANMPDEWGTTIRRVVDDPRYSRGMHFLWDRRQLGPPPSTIDLKRAANGLRVLAERIGPCRFAAVVEDPASFGMYRMLATLVDSAEFEVGVFLDDVVARRWLETGDPLLMLAYDQQLALGSRREVPNDETPRRAS